MGVVIAKGDVEVGFVEGPNTLTDVVSKALTGASSDVQEFAAVTTTKFQTIFRTYLDGITEIQQAQRALTTARGSTLGLTDRGFYDAMGANIEALNAQKQVLESDAMEGLAALAPDLQQVGQAMNATGTEMIRTGLTADRLSSAVTSIANAAASGRGDIAAFSFVTQELTETLLRAAPAYKSAGGGLAGIKAAGAGIAAGFAGTLGLMAAVTAVIGIATIAFFRWKKAQEEAKAAQEAWNKALLEGDAAVETHIKSIIKARIVQENLAETLLKLGIDAGQVEDAINGQGNSVELLTKRVAELKEAQNDLLTSQNEQTGGVFMADYNDALIVVREELKLTEAALALVNDEIEKMEAAAAFAEITAKEIARLRIEASRTATVLDDLEFGGKNFAGALLELSAAGPNIGSLLRLLKTDSIDINDILRETGGLYESNIDGVEAWITALKLDPNITSEYEVIIALLEAATAAWREEEQAEAEAAEHESVTGEKLTAEEIKRKKEEADAAEAAEKRKQEAIEATNAAEQEQLDIIEERIAARLREGDEGLQLLAAIDKVAEAEAELEGAKPEDRASAQRALLQSLIEMIALAEGADDSITVLEERIGRLVEQGVLDPDVAGAIVESLKDYEGEIALFMAAYETEMTAVVDKAEQALRSISEGKGTAEDVIRVLTEIGETKLSVETSIKISEILGMEDIIRQIRGLLTRGLLSVGDEVFITPGGIIGTATGGFLRDGEISVIGEQGPELAVGRPGGAQIIPFDLNKLKQSPNPQASIDPNRGSGEKTEMSITINNPIGEPSEDSMQKALAMVNTVTATARAFP